MTTGNDILDGFGASVNDQIKEGYAMAVLYGASPAGMVSGGGGWSPPKQQPPDPPSPNPKPFTVTVRGPDGFELKLSLTTEQWEALRPAILGAVK